MKFLKITLGLLVIVVALAAYKADTIMKPDAELGSTAPAVAFTALDDSAVSLESLRGKVVLLDFWSST